MTAPSAPSTPSARTLNRLGSALIQQLRDLDALRTTEVEQAFRAVPRHLFIPEASAEQAYEAERVEVTVRDPEGRALSSVSAARIQAFMLEQARIRPGMRVLEIGSGGCNAALVAELVGEDGQVVTVDIDPAVVDRARRLLDLAGYGRVETQAVDGDAGVPQLAPFDRILVTVEAAELAPAWIDQLAPDGRLVVPLRFRGLTRSIAFHHDGGRMASRDHEVCGFVPMRGAGAVGQQLIALRDSQEAALRIGLRIEDGVPADEAGLRAAFASPPQEAWSGLVLRPRESYGDLELWLATVLPDFALLAATREARDKGLVAASSATGSATLIDGDSFAYLTFRPTTPKRTAFEFGAIGHGPHARSTAERLAQAIGDWGDHRGDHAEFSAQPPNAPAPAGPHVRVLGRPRSRLVLAWPSTAG
ncbi:methyltransferase, FxLD system [Mangrovactinospora gilvigrisea]|uniref:Protein-L-isoaspartate O-methyltransferase n=1 Tax=Mangrovactinospora gilvigrisea TaxID=1428644 RepID=A0A1J7CCQ7_9ACTN|nr:methyltransferase, FxLD system [Mangrovactinospora gilvigrisea]OIV37458.1 methyltransferase, FxLD system [Mangrovactinospora gilvigrisea]